MEASHGRWRWLFVMWCALWYHQSTMFVEGFKSLIGSWVSGFTLFLFDTPHSLWGVFSSGNHMDKFIVPRTCLVR
jgi:hypothetical protein